MKDKELKKKWVEALRSGEYEQGQYALNRGHRNFCCLGVLCDIHPEVEWKERAAGGGELDAVYKGKSDGGMLPVTLADELGLKSGAVELTWRGDYTTLSTLNDKGHTFEEIADIIEEEL